MTRDKPRLLLALYARPKYPGTYHYSLITCPKGQEERFANGGPDQPGFHKYHVKNTLQSIEGQVVQPWIYESMALSQTSERRLLVFVVIGKVLKPLPTLATALENVPIYQEGSEKGSTFDCVEWARLAFEDLLSAGIVISPVSWTELREQSIDFVATKEKQGYWEVSPTGKWDPSIPVLDLTKQSKSRILGRS